jgi:hypothetical protein
VYGEELAPVSGALTVDPLELGRVGQAHALATGQRVRLPDACGPGAGGSPRPFVRPPNSCGCGSRASWLSYGDSADKYASSNSSTDTPKYSVGRREYIRTRQHHPAISTPNPPCEHEQIRIILQKNAAKRRLGSAPPSSHPTLKHV